MFDVSQGLWLCHGTYGLWSGACACLNRQAHEATVLGSLLCNRGLILHVCGVPDDKGDPDAGTFLIPAHTQARDF